MKKIKKIINNTGSVEYKKNKDLREYDSSELKDEKNYRSFETWDTGDGNISTYFNSDKKNYGHFSPVEIQTYDNGVIKKISLLSIPQDIFQDIRVFQDLYFYENGKLKKYHDQCYQDIHDLDVDVNKVNSYKSKDFPNVQRGRYMEFYENGFKKCEGFYIYSYRGGERYEHRYDGSLSTTDLMYSEKQYERYYKYKLWVYYDDKGDIIETIDYENGSTMFRIDGYIDTNKLLPPLDKM